jgi:GntR family transcriptional regulator
VPTGSPVIHLIHNAADENGSTLEVSESVWPSDRVVVIDDYDIAQEPEDQEGMSDV